ncbi:hypothetical protein JXA85_07065 [Candidatus Woesearchaeota archaeon]|nr:hypothetical protein [Candidatus Woesearchaeota archaeon]
MDYKLYISGSDESRLIFDEMKKREFIGEPAVFLPELLNEGKIPDEIPDYTAPQINYAPVLICGDGNEHSLSHIVSESIAGGRNNLVKIMYDAHSDDNSSSSTSCSKHLYLTSKDKRFESIYAIDDITTHSRENKKTGIRYGKLGHETDPANFLKGSLIHLSIDLDILDEPYIHYMFHDGKEEFNKLLSSVRKVAENNTIIGFDICGASAHRAFETLRNVDQGTMFMVDMWSEGAPWPIQKSFSRAAGHYKELIETILHAAPTRPCPEEYVRA